MLSRRNRCTHHSCQKTDIWIVQRGWSSVSLTLRVATPGGKQLVTMEGHLWQSANMCVLDTTGQDLGMHRHEVAMLYITSDP